MEYHIYIDSQASTKAIDYPQMQSRKSIIKQFLDYIDEIISNCPELQIKIIWIPRHENIDRNERADEETKKVAMDSIESLIQASTTQIGGNRNHQG